MSIKKKILFITLAIVFAGAICYAGFYCGAYLAKEKNPTYQQVLNFLEKDKASVKPQLSVQYDQENFAIDFKAKAQKAGFKSGVIPISLKDITYYVNVFNTKDRGLIYVDPQADRTVTVDVGKGYWVQNGFNSKPPVDDTVVKVYPIIW